jgi:hypothetical protein
MTAQRYSVTPHPIETLLTWIKSGEIAIPEIQRPFVWEAKKVRDLLDSLYHGFPVGYLIVWRNPTVKLKDGTLSAGKRILIDGQQRITALMTALLGYEVLTKDYETERKIISFHPIEHRFEVFNPAIGKNPEWISDVAKLFDPETSILELTDSYISLNPEADKRQISKTLEDLRKITNNNVGVIELDENLDVETVTEIFIRVNSTGAELSQADFAMSKIAANETYGGNLLRKAIDYFCHLSVSPEFLGKIEKNDSEFVKSEYFPKVTWLKDVKDDLYDPSYTDMLRVAFTSEFNRGKLQDLVALLSGRNFEIKQYEEEIAKESYEKLKSGVINFMNQTHFERFVMILRSAGFISSSLFGGKNSVNFAYIIYLRGRAEKLPPEDIAHAVRQWFVLSMLTGRYSGTPESVFDLDIRQIETNGVKNYVRTVVQAELSDGFWSNLLPQQMASSSPISPYFLVYQAAQVKMKDKGFLSRDITVTDLLLNRTDVHHLFPAHYLKKQGLQKGRYNQIANFALTQTEINIAIGDKAPMVYFNEILEQCQGGKKKYGGITDIEELKENLKMHCIPDGIFNHLAENYDEFLDERRKLMAQKLKVYFNTL